MLYVRCRTQRELFLDYGISILSPPKFTSSLRHANPKPGA
jgi:hypothetical protein